jgi:hypothetical protein
MVFCGSSHDYFNRVKAAEESSAFEGLRDVVVQARSITDRLNSLDFAAQRHCLLQYWVTSHVNACVRALA